MSLGAKELEDLALSLPISDWPGLGHVITLEPITVAGEVTHRLAWTRARELGGAHWDHGHLVEEGELGVRDVIQTQDPLIQKRLFSTMEKA